MKVKKEHDGKEYNINCYECEEEKRPTKIYVWVELDNSSSGIALCEEHAFKLAYKLMAEAS